MAKKSYVMVVYDRKKTSEKKGLGKVEFSIYLSHNVRKYLTICEATPLEWKRIAKRKDVLEQMAKYQKIVEAMHVFGEEMTRANFDAHLGTDIIGVNKHIEENTHNGYDQTDSFIEFIRDMQAQENVTRATMKHKRVTLRSLEEFGRIQSFADLTPANIMAYDRFLHDGIRKDVTIATYHKYVRYYINILLMEERIPRNPYARVKIKKGKSKIRQPLTEAELVKVRDAVIAREKLDRVRDLFIFMAYTGLSYIDTQHFDFKKMTVYDEQSGMYFIDGKRLKTKTDYFTPILAPAMAVLKKNDYKLLKISNQKANDHLHTIEEMLGIQHPMTCHIARHTFATLCLNHGSGIENVSKMLGHTNIKTTQRYAKVLRSSIIQKSSILASTIG